MTQAVPFLLAFLIHWNQASITVTADTDSPFLIPVSFSLLFSLRPSGKPQSEEKRHMDVSFSPDSPELGPARWSPEENHTGACGIVVFLRHLQKQADHPSNPTHTYMSVMRLSLLCQLKYATLIDRIISFYNCSCKSLQKFPDLLLDIRQRDTGAESSTHNHMVCNETDEKHRVVQQVSC